MPNPVEWILIICTAQSGNWCDYRGGVSATRISEAGCRGVMQSVEKSKDAVARCVTPDGRVFTTGKDGVVP